MSWTDERIDLLKRLWGDGLSASQIASQLGGVSRNAVIGKVHRLKLESRIRTPAAAPIEIVPVMEMARPKVVATAVSPAPQGEATAPRILAVAPSSPTPFSGGAAPLRPTLQTIGATALKMVPDEDVAPAEPAVRGSAEVVPISRNLTLVQLSDRTCKWPLGDPLAADFRFCGNHSGDSSPYCQYHARIAFQPVSERRRAR